MSVVIETTLGDVTVDLFVKERPQTCLNFLKLCKIKYYNFCLFHSVNANFLAQAGDPTGKGDGGESIFGILKGASHRLFQAEKLPRIKHDQAGLVSMVSHGDGMCGSQFIITLSSDLSSLDQEHCVFGQVVDGTDTLLKLNDAITDDQHRPYQDIRITHTVILEDPYPDPEGLPIPPSSPTVPSLRDAAYSRIPADETLTENCSQEELDEMVQQREAAARAAILEMVGDLPDAEAAPPENVLFVCKLNPVTSDHDLAIIFSRFGTVKSCEVIRDQVTGDSLQYAFVEFEERKACEDAYFKMDNVLIDDRRIHVDFSQSVAKLKWKGKGRGVDVLGPPPPGGWGGNLPKDHKRRYDGNRRVENSYAEGKPTRKQNSYPAGNTPQEQNSYAEGKPPRNQTQRVRNGIRNEAKLKPRRDPYEPRKVAKKVKRKSTSSSSSSDSSSETSSTTESSDSTHRRKKSRSRKVLVVVKTPRRSKTYKKPRKVRKNKKYETESSDSEDVKKKKKNKRKYSRDDSSSEEIERRKKRKKQQSETKKKKKRQSISSEYTTEEEKKPRAKKRKQASDSSDSEPAKKKRKDKAKSSSRRKLSKKPKKRRRSETDSSSSNSS